MGVLLYEMLVGETPPAGVVVSARAKRPELPEAVDRVILKAMAQNPDQRFQSAVEFRGALDAALRPVAPPPEVKPTQPPGETPEIEQPIERPEEGGGILDDLCGSIGLIGGAVLFAGVLRFKRRQT